MVSSRDQMGGIAKGPAQDINKRHVMLGRPSRKEVANQEETGPD
jgi:hypothetical protein